MAGQRAQETAGTLLRPDVPGPHGGDALVSLDLVGLARMLEREGRVARVVVAFVQGSAPREAGAAMLVWPGGQEGTIGGGALEWEAAARALAALREGRDRLDRMPLGPALGQCCGGVVTLLTEVWDRQRLAELRGPVHARPVPAEAVGAVSGRRRAPPGPSAKRAGGVAMDETSASSVSVSPVAGAPVEIARLPAAAEATVRASGSDSGPAEPAEAPLSVRRLLADARSQGRLPAPGLRDGWMVESVAPTTRPLWIWGAGHVGRALVTVLAPLPNFAITWVDTAPERFPPALPDGVAPLVAADPSGAVRHAPPDARHLVLTYSHALDLELCHRLLDHGFGSLGLIGSATKWARFHSRLAALGHAPEAVARIDCPIGEPGLGKHPQAIAVGVAAALLRTGGVRVARDGAA